MYRRFCEQKIKEAMQDTPVIIITGPRQAGKTTLAQKVTPKNSVFITLDDQTQLSAARTDPVGFIRNIKTSCCIIDEVQRVPELFLSIKQSVDENRVAGRFILTGSSNAMMMSQLSDALAGRMEIINLLPLTTCEIQNKPSTFVKKIFSGTVPNSTVIRIRDILIEKILCGGFPEPLSRTSQQRRNTWHQQYLNSVVQKDLEDLGEIEYLAQMPKLVGLLATQVGCLINYTEVANKLGISRQTVTNYVDLLERLFLFETLPAWHKNEAKRLVKTPKVHIVDTGLLCSLKQLTKTKIMEKPHELGHLVESYVTNEIRRLLTWNEFPVHLYHYRDKDKVEVDIIAENAMGEIVGIEVKASATITTSDFNGLRRLKNLAGDKFVMGLVLYDGDHSTAHEDKLFSAPIGCLWE